MAATAAEDLLEIVMRRWASATVLPRTEDWGKLVGDAAAVTAMLAPLAASRAYSQVRPAELAHEATQSDFQE